MNTLDTRTTGRSHWRAPIIVALVLLALAGIGYFLAYGAWFGAKERAQTSTVDIESIGRSRWRLRIIIALVVLAVAGGELSVEAAPQGGTRVKVFIPA